MRAMAFISLKAVLSVAALTTFVSAHGPLPTGKIAPTIIPAHPKPFWSWDYLPTSMHGADKNRLYNTSEVARIAKYQMYTAEKWYTPCGSDGPTQRGPSCAIETVTEGLYAQLKRLNPNITTILYWNSMFDFSFYTAHQRMLDLEAAGVHAFLRDENGEIMALCNDGNVYCNITTFNWAEPKVRELWIDTVENATLTGNVDGIFADHSGTWGNGINIGTYRNKQLPNQLCNGAGEGRLCYNFTADFKASFNSWHDWATNYTQDMLAKTTGGPVIQGPYARMGAADACSFDSIINEQKNGFRVAERHLSLTVVEADPKNGRGEGNSCKPSESCIAAFLAAAEPYTYMHCMGNTGTQGGGGADDLLGKTSFPEMDYKLGAPHGKAVEGPKNTWVRKFGDDSKPTVVTWDNEKKTGTVEWAGHP